MLGIRQENVDGVQVVHVQGRVDGFSAPELDTTLESALQAKHYRIVVDLKETEFLSSAGMRALLNARQNVHDHSGDLRLANLSPFIQDAFKLVGFQKLFKIYNSTDAAIKSF